MKSSGSINIFPYYVWYGKGNSSGTVKTLKVAKDLLKKYGKPGSRIIDRRKSHKAYIQNK